jgi:hypothetical protein
MNAIVWLFPILFMIHDFEEIIFINAWRKKYKHYLCTCTMKKKPFADFESTASFSIGVEIIFLIFSFISLFSVIFNNYYIWYGFFFFITVHFVTIHFSLVFNFKHYVPGFITSIIFLPISIYILYTATLILRYSSTKIVLSCVACSVLSYIIYVFLHSVEKDLENKLRKFSNKTL